MPPGAIVNDALLETSRIAFSTRFNQVFMAVEDPLRQLAMELPSDHPIEEYDWLGAVPGLEEWIDERVLSELRAEQIKIANKEFASGIRIKRRTLRDDKLGLIMPRIDMLAQKAGLHYGKLIAECLVNGFNTTSKYGAAYDGQAFFSNSHQEGDGPVQSNLSDAPLSLTSFFAARAQMGQLVDERGDDLGIQGTTLFVGYDNERTAREIAQAGVVLATNAEGGGGVTNVAQGLANVVVVPSLKGAYANYWFLADLTAPVRPIILQVREGITTSMVGLGTEEYFMKSEMKFGAEGEHGVGFGLWQFIFGSDGSA